MWIPIFKAKKYHSAQSNSNVPPQSPQGSDPTITLVLQIPHPSPLRTTSSTSVSQGKSPSTLQALEGDIDLRPPDNFVARPRNLLLSRLCSSELPLPSRRSDSTYQSKLGRLGKQLPTGITSGTTGGFSPSFLEERGPSAQSQSSTSGSVCCQWRNSYSLQHVVEYLSGDQDVEGKEILAETLRQLEEEDRLLAEELERIEEMDFNLALQWQDEQLREEHFRLEELTRIASEDALLAAELARQEQEEYEEGQRLKCEKAERQNELERQERERKRQEKAILLRDIRGLGVPVAVRRIGHFGGFGEGNLDEVTPEIMGHLKSVKTLFLKHLPGHRITKIEWIINPILQEQFEDTRQKLRNFGRSTKEVILFHGTAPANVDS